MAGGLEITEGQTFGPLFDVGDAVTVVEAEGEPEHSINTNKRRIETAAEQEFEVIGRETRNGRWFYQLEDENDSLGPGWCPEPGLVAKNDRWWKRLEGNDDHNPGPPPGLTMARETWSRNSSVSIGKEDQEAWPAVSSSPSIPFHPRAVGQRFEQAPNGMPWEEVDLGDSQSQAEAREAAAAVDEYRDTRSHRSRFLARVARSLRDLSRPRLKQGRRRVEWLCTCGKLMYRDYGNTDPAKSEDLLKDRFGDAGYSALCKGALVQLRTVPQQGGAGSGAAESSGSNGGSGGSNPGSGAPPKTSGSQSQGQGQPGTGTAGGSGQGSGGSAQGGGRSGGGSNAPSNHPYQQQATHGQQQDPKMFLELCVSSGGNITKLGEVDITALRTDGEIFREVNKKYRELRPATLRRCLRKPVGVDFDHFQVIQQWRAGIRACGSLPSTADLDYSCVCGVPPPMDNREFVHYLSDHYDKHNTEYRKALPKKKDESIFALYSSNQAKIGSLVSGGPLVTIDGIPTYGWGMHIIEGPNKSLLTWIVVVIEFFSFAVSVFITFLFKTQEQGFGVGQWLVSVLATTTVALYFEWENT